MTQWLVKDLSKLTGVSVQTLHYYDRINLLKPSLRLPNGYRVYSEKDLLQLQQIIALKFLGFELSQIKTLLVKHADAFEHFTEQVHLLEEKAQALQEAAKTLKSVISKVNDDKSICWESIIQLIEVYRMAQQLEHPWVKEIFTPEELKQYIAFETEMKTSATPEQKAEFEKNWADLVEKIRIHIKEDPASEIGIRLAKQCMQHVNSVYGKKYAHLRTKKFEKGFAEGRGLVEVGLTPELVSWLEKAMDAYWKRRAYDVLNQVGKIPESAVLNLWNEMLDEMYGEDTARKKAVYDLALKDGRVSQEAKQWLSKVKKES